MMHDSMNTRGSFSLKLQIEVLSQQSSTIHKYLFVTAMNACLQTPQAHRVQTKIDR